MAVCTFVRVDMDKLRERKVLAFPDDSVMERGKVKGILKGLVTNRVID